jgi:hypothetical protein
VSEADMKMYIEKKNLYIKDTIYHVYKPRREWIRKKYPEISARLIV